MAGLRAWWRSGAGALAACFIAVFAVIPALDALVCEADAATPAQAVAMSVAHTHAAETHPAHKSHAEAGGYCMHGHCHQVSAEAPPAVMIETLVRVDSAEHRLIRSSFPVEGRHFPLIRPPRA